MKQAKIKCPHCGSGFVVRQVDAGDIDPEDAAKLWAESDAAFKAMNDVFKKFFDPLFDRIRRS